MKHSFKIFLLFLFSLLVTVNCGGTTGGSSSPTPPSQIPIATLPMGQLSTSNIVLTSDNLTSIDGAISAFLYGVDYGDFEPRFETNGENCHAEGNQESTDGLCITPINISGYASSVGLGRSGGGAPVRLFGSTLGSISLDRNGELEVSPFDFQDRISMEGESSIQDDTGSGSWDLLQVYTAYMDVQLQINDEFWTVRYAFISQQPASESTIESCVEDHYFESIQANSGLLAEGETEGSYKKGDKMLCVKSSASETCADSDFQWLDLDSGSFVSTRPSNPLQHEWANNEDVTCSQDDPGYDINLGFYDIYATIENPFELSAEYNTCYPTFTYTDPNTNETTTGNTLNAEFDFDMTGSVYLREMTETETETNAEIFQSLYFKQMYLRDQLAEPAAPGDELALSVTANISVTEDSLTCLDEGDVASTYLTGVDCTPDSEIKTDCEYEICSPGFEAVSGTIWSKKSEGSCETYCTRQTCQENNGQWKNIYCVPECN